MRPFLTHAIFHNTGLSQFLTITIADFTLVSLKRCFQLSMIQLFCHRCESATKYDSNAISVADPECYPESAEFYLYRIQQQQQIGRGEVCCLKYFCSHWFHKIKNYFIFEQLQKKIGASWQRVKLHFYIIIVTKLSKVWVGDSGSRIQARGQQAPDTDPQPCYFKMSLTPVSRPKSYPT